MKPDKFLNFWQMSFLLGAGMGFPSMLIGGQVSMVFGVKVAIASVLVGNILIWLVGLGISSMSERSNNAIENIENYLGKNVGFITSLVLFFAFLGWFTVQLDGATLITYSSEYFSDAHIFCTVLLGIIVSGISYYGIRAIARICIWSFPVLVAFSIILLFSSNRVLVGENWHFSMEGASLIIASWLPGMINIPTFFRHAKTREDAFLSLTLIVIFQAFFQIVAILSGFSSLEDIASTIKSNHNVVYSLYIVTFNLLFFLCINLVNIYFASAAWDKLIPSYQGRFKYMIIGFLGTAGYIFISLFNRVSVENFVLLITCFLSSLGIVMLMNYLVSLIVHHRPRVYEKFWSGVSWAVGCSAALILHFMHLGGRGLLPLIGIMASMLAFLIIIFIEETIWSFKNLSV